MKVEHEESDSLFIKSRNPAEYPMVGKYNELIEKAAAVHTLSELNTLIFAGRSDLKLLDIGTDTGEFLLNIYEKRKQLGISTITGLDIDITASLKTIEVH